MNYNPDMSAADKEADNLLLVIPTGDPDHPLMVEQGRWDADDQRWEGEWRHWCTDETHAQPVAAALNDPIAWAAIPEIDASLFQLVQPRAA